MKKIFRSILNIKKDGKPTIPMEELVRNYKVFLASKIEPEDPSYIKLWTWIEAHYREYKEVPSIELMFEKAAAEGNEPLFILLKDIAGQLAYIRSDYKAIIKEKFEQQNQENFKSVLERTWQIASSGMRVFRKDLKGMKDALLYLSTELRRFRMTTTGVKTDSQILSEEDSREILEEYEKRKRDPLSTIGLFTFLDKIDDAFRGIKPGDLCVIAAYTSMGKSTMAANLTYNGIMQGLNGMIVPLEKNFAQTRELFYILHTCNPEWHDHPKYKNLASKISLQKLKYGELSDLEYEFFKVAATDFSMRAKTGGFGELKIWQPTEPLTSSLLEMEVLDYQAELQERGKNLDFLVIDYVSLMVVDKKEKYGDYNTDLNSIIKRLKNFALTFNEGKGLRIITPFQVNREGVKDAAKNDGIYKLTALSNANESERSADEVFGLYMSEEMRKTGVVKICCLKHRDGAFFSPFEAQIDYTNMRINDYIQTKSQAPDDDISINEIPLDV